MLGTGEARMVGRRGVFSFRSCCDGALGEGECRQQKAHDTGLIAGTVTAQPGSHAEVTPRAARD